MPRGPEHYEEYIRSRKVRPPVNYNDPFDSQWDILWRVPERLPSVLDQALRNPTTWPKEMDSTWRAKLEKEVDRIAALPESDRDRERNRLLEDVHAAGLPAKEDQFLQDLLRRMRVFCLCAEDRSLLMWSHYAEQHRGVLLGFDTATFERDCQRALEQVQYRAELPDLVDAGAYARSSIFGLPTPLLPEGSLKGWALFKSADCAYEKEWRFVGVAPQDSLGDCEDFTLPRAALVEVVVGCRGKVEDAAEIKRCAVAIQPKVRLGQMSLHPERFELTRQVEDNRGVP